LENAYGFQWVASMLIGFQKNLDNFDLGQLKQQLALKQVGGYLSSIQHAGGLVIACRMMKKLCFVKIIRPKLHHLFLERQHIVESLFVDDTQAVLFKNSDLTLVRRSLVMVKDQAVLVSYDWARLLPPCSHIVALPFKLLGDFFVERWASKSRVESWQ
jgi:hypothetical protein